jgi:hypothetical protein
MSLPTTSPLIRRGGLVVGGLTLQQHTQTRNVVGTRVSRRRSVRLQRDVRGSGSVGSGYRPLLRLGKRWFDQFTDFVQIRVGSFEESTRSV